VHSTKPCNYRIAIVGGSLSAQGGGAPRSMAQQAAVLVEQGCFVTFFVGESRKYPLAIEQFDVAACEVVHSRLWGPSILGFFPVALLKLCFQLKTFDVIHLNGAWNFNTFLMSRMARLLNVPCFITTRGHYSEYHHQRMPRVRKLLYGLMERGNLRNATAMHTTASWEQKTSARYLSQARAIVNIPNPVDLRDFNAPPSRAEARERLGLDPHRFYLVHLGRLAPQKNAPLLTEAFLSARLADAELVFIGPEEVAVRKQVDQLMASHPNDAAIRFVPFAKGTDRCDWLAAADVFVLPSNDENFCIVAIEAVASGTHCLLSDRVGAIEYLPKEYCSVCPLDVERWVEALRALHQNRIPQKTPPPEVLAPFSHEAIGAQWKTVYEGVLNDDDN